MRKLIPTASLINRVGSFSLTKYFTYSEPAYFKPIFNLKNFLLRELLKVEDAEVTITKGDNNYSERFLIANLKEQGFLHDYGEGVLYNDYPKFNYAGIFFYVDKNHSEEIQTAWGYTLPYNTVGAALSKGIGEALERQSSYYIPNNKTAKFPNLRKGDASYLFKHIPKFTTSQIAAESKLVGSADDMRDMLGFTASSLTGGGRRFFPFEAFYWGLPASPEQKLFQHTTTSGSGGGKTREEALLSGCYEVIERDHFMLYWLSGIKPDIIQNDTLTEPFRSYVKRAKEQYKLEIYFMELKYDVEVITGACLIIDPILNKVTIGAKSGLNGQSVLEGAFLEAIAVLSTTRAKDEAWSETELRDLLEKPAYTQTISRKGRVNMYSNAFGVGLIRKKLTGGKEITFSAFNRFDNLQHQSAKEDLQYVLQQFKQLVKDKGDGYHVFSHFFSSHWLRKLNYKSAHIFVPSMMKLHLNEHFATPLSPRLTDFAATHGLTVESEKDLNPVPHFFP